RVAQQHQSTIAVQLIRRLHYRVWAAPEKYSSWVNAYQQLALNPLALKTK
ncbi:TPA: hypothetical protein L7T43_005436, partial [Klebsiella pneumoniae]|nr:hypothetical protein [Klebsiella pneumoniae]